MASEAKETFVVAGPTIGGVFVGCTNLRALEVVEVLERATAPDSIQQYGIYVVKP
ncbi:MAG: hypothetical protein QXK66_03925 [Sulfolobales archaeon]